MSATLVILIIALFFVAIISPEIILVAILLALLGIFVLLLGVLGILAILVSPFSKAPLIFITSALSESKKKIDATTNKKNKEQEREGPF